MKYFEVVFNDSFSIACRGKRIPTIEEAEVFCYPDVEMFGDIVCIVEINYEEVVKLFDTTGIDYWPIFS